VARGPWWRWAARDVMGVAVPEVHDVRLPASGGACRASCGRRDRQPDATAGSAVSFSRSEARGRCNRAPEGAQEANTCHATVLPAAAATGLCERLRRSDGHAHLGPGEIPSAIQVDPARGSCN